MAKTPETPKAPANTEVRVATLSAREEAALRQEAENEARKQEFLARVMEARAAKEVPPPVPPKPAPRIMEQTKAEMEAGAKAVAAAAKQQAERPRPAPTPGEATTTAVFRPADFVPDPKKPVNPRAMTLANE